MGFTTKTRTLGARLLPKLGVNWNYIWLNASDGSTPWLPGGETYATMASHAATQGISTVTIWWDAGDYSSFQAHGEIRPGLFWYGSGAYSRDANGDFTGDLKTSAQAAPEPNNIKSILDACYANRIKVLVKLESWNSIDGAGDWIRHPYHTNRECPNGNLSLLPPAGFIVDPDHMWTNASARAYFKDRIDAFLFNFGDHKAIEAFSLGNELMFTTDTADFIAWCDEMSTYLWSQYGTQKPYITVDSITNTWADAINDVYADIAGDRRMMTWHNYNDYYTLQEIFDYIRGGMDDYNLYTPATQEWPSQQRRYWYRIGENWGFGCCTQRVPLGTTDVNIQGDPFLETYAYEDPPDDTIAPYPHERMYAFLAFALDPTMQYLRWNSFLDGSGDDIVNTQKRSAEIMRTVSDMYNTCVLHEVDMIHWEDQISASGALAFKAASYLKNVCLTFVLVGSGNQTIDFGITGNWTMVTYDWDGDGADNAQRNVDEVVVNAAATAIAFGDYTSGFVAGYLIKNTDFRNPVRTTITTTVNVVVV